MDPSHPLGQDGCPTLFVSGTIHLRVQNNNITFSFKDTVNSQVHELTKYTPYELVFGQPPRSVVLLDVAFRGKIDLMMTLL